MDLSIFGLQSTTLTVTALLTGALLVFAALLIAYWIGPRSYSVKKSEPYECGIPSRGESMSQYRVGYYLFAILFLIFDVETVFLFPWAVIAAKLGTQALLAVGVFLAILILGLAYAWRKGALEWQ